MADTSSILSALLSSSAIKGISKTSNASTDEVQRILANAVPALLQGANKQATSKSTAENFAAALSQHAQDDTSNITSFMKNVDLDDGTKILGHLLGSSEKSTTAQISKASGTSAAKTISVLSALAPLLMSLLGQQTQSSSGGAQASMASSLLGGLMQNVNAGNLLGSLLGASSGSSKPSSSSAGSLLGGLMGLLK
ncbi:MAG: DUF937 domain-containing protein [Treponema sp.]|nr:DUF937 domain-containing protein [Treponema sp.]